MTPAEIEAIAEQASDRAIEKMLLTLGIRIDDAIETQKDMAHLRAWRVGTERLGFKATAALVVVVVSGLASAVWVGIKAALHGS